MFNYEDHLNNIQEAAKEFGVPTTSNSDSLADIAQAMLNRVNAPLDPIVSSVEDDAEYNRLQQRINQGLAEIDELFAELAL